jgi:catechol 2,3-dioxygenase-like lactoylglutathione lyase family enzyme
MLNKFGTIALWVSDFPDMYAFYRDTLRLPLSSADPGEGHQAGVNWARFELEGTALELFDLAHSPKRAARTPLPRQNAAILCFLVQDFEKARDELALRGVKFTQQGQADWGKYAHFRDPEGNELQIYRQNEGY